MAPATCPRLVGLTKAVKPMVSVRDECSAFPLTVVLLRARDVDPAALDLATPVLIVVLFETCGDKIRPRIAKKSPRNKFTGLCAS